MLTSFDFSAWSFWALTATSKIIRSGKVSHMANNISFEMATNGIKVYLHCKENNPADCNLWGIIEKNEDANKLLGVVRGWASEN